MTVNHGIKRGVMIIVLLISCLSIGICSYAWAGNKQMVEKTVEEMDELNKQAVQQIPDLPESGKVNIKADVTYEKGEPVFDIYYKKITGEKEGTLDFGGSQDTNSTEKGMSEENDDEKN